MYGDTYDEQGRLISRFAQHTVEYNSVRERYGERNGEIARRLGIRKGEEVDFRAELSFL